MNLPVPEEPTEIKMLIRSVRERLGGSDIDSDALAVWAFNRLPKYLWSEWKNELKKGGISWQKFLKLLKFHEIDLIEWGLKDNLSWVIVVKRIERTISLYSGEGGVSEV